jgi:hypothetical protein
MKPNHVSNAMLLGIIALVACGLECNQALEQRTSEQPQRAGGPARRTPGAGTRIPRRRGAGQAQFRARAGDPQPS